MDLIDAASRIVGHLSFRNKLRLAAAMFGVPLALAAVIALVELQADVQALRTERAALAVQVPALALLVAIHGDAAGRVVRADDGVATVGAGAADPAAALARVRERVTAAGLGGKDWPAGLDEALAATDGDIAEQHARRIGHVRAGLDALNDRSRLIVDGDVASHRLIAVLLANLPDLIDATGNAGRIGAGVLAAKRLKGARRNELTLLRGNFDPLVRWSLGALEKVSAEQPELAPPLEALGSRLNTAYLGVQEALTTRMLETSEIDMPPTEFVERTRVALDESLAIAAALAGHADALLAEREARLAQRRNLIVAAIVAVLLLAMVGVVTTNAAIARGLRGLTLAVDRMAAGDLSARAEVSTGDELAALGRQFNGMGEGFSKLIRDTVTAVGSVSGAGQAMSAQSIDIAGASRKLSTGAERVASSIETLTRSIGEVAEHAHATSAIADSAARSALDEERRASAAIEGLAAVRGEVVAAVESIRRLEERSRQIDAIVRTIDEVAEQTNLLALNAAIEAARAGEQGRGFAVVADEVRKLADRTGQSTRDVGTMVAAIQRDTADVAAKMAQAGAGVASGADRVGELAEAMRALREAVDSSARHVADIVVAAEEERCTSVDIAAQVQAMAAAADENHRALDAGVRTARDLSALAERLQQSVTGLRVD